MNRAHFKAAAAATFLITIAAPSLAQTPSTPGPLMSPTTPSLDESGAKSKLQEQGYGDARGLQSNPDGSWSGQATRDGSERKVTVDPSGNIKTR